MKSGGKLWSEVGPKEQAEREEKKANAPEEQTNVDSAMVMAKRKRDFQTYLG